MSLKDRLVLSLRFQDHPLSPTLSLTRDSLYNNNLPDATHDTSTEVQNNLIPHWFASQSIIEDFIPTSDRQLERIERVI